MTQPSTTPSEVDGGAVRLTTTAPPEQDQIVLFYIDDTPYTVPRTIPANMSMRFLQVVAHRGSGVASLLLFEEMLGDDALEALRNCDGMTKEQFATLRTKFQDLFVGQVDELINGPKD